MATPATTMSDAPAASELGVLRNPWRRRLLAGLLLVVAIAGGPWWWITSLNSTERQLLGVWELVNVEPKTVMFLVEDRNQFAAFNTGKWECVPFPIANWKASREEFILRTLPQGIKKTQMQRWNDFWQDFLDIFRKRGAGTHHEFVTFSAEAFEYRSDTGEMGAFRRSKDPELLRIFDRLSAGESPQ